MCIGCDELLTRKHIFTCSDFIEARERHYAAQSLRVLSEEISVEKIFNCLKERNIFGRI